MTATQTPPTVTAPPAGPPPRRRRAVRTALSDMRGTLRLVGVLLVAIAAVIVIGLIVNPAPAAIRATTVDYAINMPTTLSAGTHTIRFTNHGSIGHEIVIFKTDRAADALPLKDGNVNEDALQSVADSGDALQPGGTETVTTADLTPGHYVVVCNLPGHYKAGMRLDLTVK
jgi:uncharacterized cupredoxin-like copper-binding protein